MVVFVDRYALGADPLAYFSRSRIRKTMDYGLTWQDLAAPFDVHSNIISAARGLLGMDYPTIALSNSGKGAYSTDWTNWVSYDFTNPSWQLNKIIYSSITQSFLAVGFEKNLATRAERAIVVDTTSGVDASTFTKRYMNMDPYSGLFDICQLDYQNYLAAGYCNEFSTPLLLWSSDTVTWQAVTLPASISGPLYSVAADAINNIIRIGGNGFVATANWQGPYATSWVVNDRLLRNGKRKAITTLVDTTGLVTVTGMALSGDTIFWSQNQYDYTPVTVPGYSFKSAYFDGTKWYFGATSRLNQYTGFFGTFTAEANPTLLLTGFNNGVHTYSWLS